MKRKYCILMALLVMAFFVACSTAETSPEHQLTYVDSKIMEIPFNDETLDCVCVFTEYTNSSGSSVMPADYVNVRAYQNGIELTIWVFTGEKTEGYIQCDTYVQDGTTADVVWIFEREDDSMITVEFSDGQTFTVE